MLTIWHNPRCSKSRATLALLQERGLSPRVVDYLKDPPSAATLKKVLAVMGKGPRDLIRKGEAAYAALGLDDPALSDAALVKAMVENPILIERPVVLNGDRAALGRPPEAVLAIL
ncbi:arsenate reductase (glutaredoxin) [Amphiplicatus metriothermophilus]|uniref:Arsenate reductase n=1 Tax=Amphiplicatus metriothermophilus TaxID=1519374 RepID=A0A239PKZ6_9PROT|nr:arsenate reductase (glutaredoxin) [Amphiplicatus metriothermophilus]MBB5517677.1 arsenate reductase [Amphiplicatus metriothermophilus]SNT67989.1 arsenate reductase [Amphiplicatus metriothermophilus]